MKKTALTLALLLGAITVANAAAPHKAVDSAETGAKEEVTNDINITNSDVTIVEGNGGPTEKKVTVEGKEKK